MSIEAELERACKNTQRDCLNRIRDLRVTLDSIVFKIGSDKDAVLNPLGELQGVANILDCRLAALAVLRNLRSDGRED